MFSPDGTTSLGFLGHSDPIPTEPDPVLVTSGSNVECVPNTSGTYYIHVIYARAHNDADGYSTWAPTIRSMISSANQLVHDATVATGGTGAGLKVYCTGGTVVVENEVLPTSKSSATFSSIVNDLKNKGYDDGKKKYWVFYDDTGACTCGGQGHIYYDEDPSASNANNGNGVPMFAVNYGYNSVRIMLHELGHNLGAVQDGAPRSTKAGHCYDGRDTMCYNDGGPNGHLYSTGYCSTEVWDCGRNDYFNANPAPGSYLATKWNLGNPVIRYIRFGEVNSGPTLTTLNCAPLNAVLGDTVTCDFAATDTRDNVSYNVEWGDGTTARVPATGFVPSGTLRSASRTYATDGSFTVRVSATDDNATNPLTGGALTRAVSVQAAPTMALVSCAPSPAEVGRSVTCSFRANDNSSGVYYNVQWGDGQTQRIPASGTVAPGTTRTATHTWSSAGTFTVRANATDNGVPALTSADLTTPLLVQPNAAPGMASLSCSPNPVQAQNPTTCSFVATDDFSALYYMIDWGDGSAQQRVPATGTVAPGVTKSASKTYGADGNFTVQVRATDDGAPPLTSNPIGLVVQATTANIAPVMVLATCEPGSAHAATTCSFRATDTDANGLRYTIQWGDGTSSVLPTTGFATAGATYTTGHTYTAPGTYPMSAYATDNGSPARTSNTLTSSVVIGPDITPPTLSVQEPRSGRAYWGCGTVQQTLSSQDTLFVRRGCVKATASDPSGIANVTVRLDGVVVGVVTAAPYQLDFAVFPGLDQALAVTAYDTLGNARTITLRVDAV